MKLGALELEIEWNVLATRINDKTCYLFFYYVFLEVYHLLLGCYLNFKVVDNFFCGRLEIENYDLCN